MLAGPLAAMHGAIRTLLVLITNIGPTYEHRWTHDPSSFVTVSNRPAEEGGGRHALVAAAREDDHPPHEKRSMAGRIQALQNERKT